MRIGKHEIEQDLYGTLGVASDASTNEIKRAYRRRAAQVHPDRAGAPREGADLEMKRVNLAASVLLDPAARARYDEQRARHLSQTASAARARPSPTEQPSSRRHASTSSSGEPVSARPAPGPERDSDSWAPRSAGWAPRSAGWVPSRLVGAAFALTIAIALLSNLVGGPVPVSSSDYRVPGPVQRVSAWAD